MHSWIPLATCVLLAAGCAALVPQKKEPKAFVVRNGTNVVLRKLTVEEVPFGERAVLRKASFSGVPPKTNQYIRRRVNSGVVPQEVIVTWQEPNRQVIRRNARAANAELRAKGRGELILVLEILPNRSIALYLVDEDSVAL
ncbi:MAG: hypothetical protein ACYTGO_19205 [Planctomycetota bacterium]|jgi:hypothetical protein